MSQNQKNGTDYKSAQRERRFKNRQATYNEDLKIKQR